MTPENARRDHRDGGKTHCRQCDRERKAQRRAGGGPLGKGGPRRRVAPEWAPEPTLPIPTYEEQLAAIRAMAEVFASAEDSSELVIIPATSAPARRSRATGRQRGRPSGAAGTSTHHGRTR
jgi:hypothetical protein